MEHGPCSPITSITKLFFCGGYPRIKSNFMREVIVNLYNYFKNVGRLTWCMVEIFHVQFMVMVVVLSLKVQWV